MQTDVGGRAYGGAGRQENALVCDTSLGRGSTGASPQCRYSTAEVQRSCKPKVGGSNPPAGTSCGYFTKLVTYLTK
jgi:hypothetical protein